MRAGEFSLPLGDHRLTGRLTIAALDRLQSRTGLHPLDLFDTFEKREDRAAWTDEILICGLTGGGLPLGSAEALISGPEAPFVAFAYKRDLALSLLIAGLLMPDLGKDRDEAPKKTIARVIRWISRAFTFKGRSLGSRPNGSQI